MYCNNIIVSLGGFTKVYVSICDFYGQPHLEEVVWVCLLWSYRKIPKISPGAYIFQRPFLRGLFLERPKLGGAYVWREICISNSIGLACSGKEIYHFCFVFLCTQGQIPSTSPPRAYIWRGNLTEGFLRYDFGGLIFGGAYTWRGLFSEFYGMSVLLCSLTRLPLSCS